MNDDPLPRLNPEALKTERHDDEHGTEAEAAGHDHVDREPGRAPDDDAPALAQPTSGATPPAR